MCSCFFILKFLVIIVIINSFVLSQIYNTISSLVIPLVQILAYIGISLNNLTFNFILIIIVVFFQVLLINVVFVFCMCTFFFILLKVGTRSILVGITYYCEWNIIYLVKCACKPLNLYTLWCCFLNFCSCYFEPLFLIINI